MPLNRRLSTLEMTVLGVILKRGPCTAYAVMTEFSSSQTSAYRSGAGSIYPLISRLEKFGAVSSHTTKEGKEKRYQITEEGQKMLRSWFLEGLDEDAFSCSLDVLRSRTYFLRVLSQDERETFFLHAIAGLRKLQKACQTQVKSYQQSGDKFSEHAMRGALMETQTRIRWLKAFQSETRQTL